eukprot:12317387-Karenia_brevis.AAC.1
MAAQWPQNGRRMAAQWPHDGRTMAAGFCGVFLLLKEATATARRAKNTTPAAILRPPHGHQSCLHNICIVMHSLIDSDT